MDLKSGPDILMKASNILADSPAHESRFGIDISQVKTTCVLAITKHICNAGFSIEGPSQAKIDCNDNGDGSANVSYWPTEAGEYAVHVLCNEEDIPNSPFMANIIPKVGDFNPTKVGLV